MTSAPIADPAVATANAVSAAWQTLRALLDRWQSSSYEPNHPDLQAMKAAVIVYERAWMVHRQALGAADGSRRARNG